MLSLGLNVANFFMYICIHPTSQKPNDDKHSTIHTDHISKSFNITNIPRVCGIMWPKKKERKLKLDNASRLVLVWFYVCTYIYITHKTIFDGFSLEWISCFRMIQFLSTTYGYKFDDKKVLKRIFWSIDTTTACIHKCVPRLYIT